MTFDEVFASCRAAGSISPAASATADFSLGPERVARAGPVPSHGDSCEFSSDLGGLMPAPYVPTAQLIDTHDQMHAHYRATFNTLYESCTDEGARRIAVAIVAASAELAAAIERCGMKTS
jgi:hypothetical protein